MTLIDVLTSRMLQAVEVALPAASLTAMDQEVRRSRAEVQADFQWNGALPLGKALGRPPREVAEEIVPHVVVDPEVAELSVAGPGFINIVLADAWLRGTVSTLARDTERLVPAVPTPNRVLIDYSSPNVAKEMHVGHLRSTIIGDALARLLEAQGHSVTRVSHVGDWGTQFGMLIAHLSDMPDQDELTLSELDAFYKAAKARFDADDVFRGRARRMVVALQQGDPTARQYWEDLCARSRAEFAAVYSKLGVSHLEERGESSYQPHLQSVIDDLESLGLLTVDNGAKCVFPPGFTNRDGEQLPLIVQKADGGFNYATTDLAAIRERVREGNKSVLYVVDAGQAQHFAMVFSVATSAGWVPEDVSLVHVPFGLVLGDDLKRMRTRSGESVRLIELLQEAEDRAGRLAEERVGDSDQETAHRVGIGAVKYAELSHNRMSDYKFSFDKMISLKGNTAPYLMYVIARIISVERQATGAPASDEMSPMSDPERALAVSLVGFGDAVQRASSDYSPHHLCEFLFSLAQAYNGFYEECRLVSESGGWESELRRDLSVATKRTLQEGLGLLGVEPVEAL